MVPLPKHLRPRWRYLGVGIEAWPDAAVDREDFQRALWESARALLGDAASADLDLTVLSFRFADGAGSAVVRSRRSETDRARAALSCVEAVDGQPVGLRVRGVSGTVRACEENYIRRGQEAPDQRRVVFEDAEYTGTKRAGRVDVRTDEGYSGATTLDIE